MVKIKICFFCLFLMIPLTAVFAQKKKAAPPVAQTSSVDTSKIKNGLLYIVDSDPSQFMVPYIEQKLKNLRKPGFEEKLFDTVLNLNTLTQSTKIEAQIVTKLITHQVIASADKQQKPPPPEYKYFPDYIKRFPTVLIIKINTFQNQIEYQFTLYRDDSTGNTLKYNASSSVFVDPEKGGYQAAIIRTLQQVFIQASMTPDFEMHTYPVQTRFDTTATLLQPKAVRTSKKPAIIETQIIGAKYYLSQKDSIVFDPVISDTGPDADRIYFWNRSKGPIVQFAPASKKQIFKKLMPGEYGLSFSYTNGINYSRTDSIFLNVYTPPELQAYYGPKLGYFDGANQLYIQHYLFLRFRARLDAKLTVVTLKRDFRGNNLTLCYNLIDDGQKSILPGKTQVIEDDTDKFQVEGSLNSFTGDYDNERLGHLISGKYYLTYQAHTDRMKSDTLLQGVLVYQRPAISIVVAGSYLPLRRGIDEVNSTLALAMGANFKFSDHFSMDAMEMGNIFNGPFSRYFTGIMAGYDGFDDDWGLGTGILVSDNKNARVNTVFQFKGYGKVWNFFNGELRAGSCIYSDFGHFNMFGVFISRTFSFNTGSF